MSILLKIQKGTLPDNKNLCHTCTRGVVTVNSHGKELVRCTYMDKDQNDKIVQCSRYYNAALPSLSDMYEIAWILETSRNRRSVGFTPWKDYRKKNPDEYVPD